MHRTACAVAVAALLLASVAATVPAAGAGGGAIAASAPADVDADSVLLRADVHANGSAQWTVSYRIRLGGNRTAAYEELAADIESNRSAYLDPFRDRMTRTVRTASNATGREMTATDFSVSTHRTTFGQEYGVVTYAFEWSGFAAVDGDRLRVGDAVAGIFLDGETTLQFGYPSAYRVASASPEPTDRRAGIVEWDGPMSFTRNEPTLVLTSAPPGPGTATVAAALAVLLVAAGGGYYLYARRRGEAGDGAAAATDASGAAAAESPEEPAGGAAADATEEGPPSELLSNEERVVELLERNGGRVKQQQIVSGLDWTEAKTSQVVNSMRDEGELEVFRIGRENVVKLPDEDQEDEDDRR